jgi:tetratricopeptide (TPR) repeat protein
MPVFGGENAESYYDEGVTASMKGDLAQAIAFFEKALHLDTGHLAAKQQLAKCYLRQGQPRQAAEILYQVVKAKPTQIPPRLDLGQAFLDMNLPDRAYELFSEISRAKPDNARASLGLACAAFQQGQWDAAALLAGTAIQQGGANFAAYYLLGRAGKLAGRIDSIDAFASAEKQLEKSIETSPDQPEGYYLRGELYYVQEDFAKALDSYAAARERAKADMHYSAFNEHFSVVDILGRQGMCQKRLGMAAPQRETAARILEMDPNNATGLMLNEG